MTHNYSTIYAGLLASALMTGLLSGCDNSESPTGKLNLDITDAAVDGADNVFVVFTGVEIKAGSETIDINYDTPRKIDLLALTGGIAETIVDNQTLPAGQVEWIRLKVNATSGGDPIDDSYIVIEGTPHELTIPSGAQNGLKLNRPITIADGGVASFTIDFDLRKSVHMDNNGYKLRPTLRLVDNQTKGALHGSFAAANCDDISKAAIYVYQGSDIVADDEGSDTAPVTTAKITVVDTMAPVATYQYTVDFLTAGDYTVAYTCTADLDDPATNDDIQFSGAGNVTIVAGQTAMKNFEAVAAAPM
jgi:hypothetical protein